MKRIAVLTSGGDAPCMNAAIKAVVRSGIEKDGEVIGICNGYAGLISGNLLSLGARDVGGIIQKSGTILGSTRCPEFVTQECHEKVPRVGPGKLLRIPFQSPMSIRNESGQRLAFLVMKSPHPNEMK